MKSESNVGILALLLSPHCPNDPPLARVPRVEGFSLGGVLASGTATLRRVVLALVRHQPRADFGGVV